jgi:pimeloyl-ACP methyl ester carboxylesterase
MSAPVARRFVEVEGRRVHYRRSGSGPPLVLLHGSPGNSAMLEHEVAAASAHFTCFAFDTPGFGDSDALPGEELQVSDLAGATVAAMRKLGLPPCPVYGTHTGAAIAIEIGVGWPEAVTGLVMEGLPAFTEAEIAQIFVNYFQPMIADPLGGHLVSTWTRFRDQFTWFPWTSRNVTRLNPVDRPAPADIDLWVMMFYRSCRSYRPAYRAACFYGQRAVRAAEALTVPAVYMAGSTDMLFPHLDRLPPLKAGQRIERLHCDDPAKCAAIVEFVRSLPSARAAAQAAEGAAARPVGKAPAVQFIDGPDAQVFVRCYGAATRPALILLHDAPGTGLALDAIARTLAVDAYVIVPDLPGNGESAAPPASRAALEAGADAVLALVDAWQLRDCTVAGVGCGSAVAATLAARRDARIGRVLLERVPVPDEAVAAQIAPDIELSPEGAHWVKAWLMVRDGQIYDPWFDGRIAAQRRTQGNFDADWLHDQTFALMKSRTTYQRLPREAWRFDGRAALARADAARVQVAADGNIAALLHTLNSSRKSP